MTLLQPSGLHLVFMEIIREQELPGPALLVGLQRCCIHRRWQQRGRWLAVTCVWSGSAPLWLDRAIHVEGGFSTIPKICGSNSGRQKGNEDLKQELGHLLNINGQSLALQWELSSVLPMKIGCSLALTFLCGYKWLSNFPTTKQRKY